LAREALTNARGFACLAAAACLIAAAFSLVPAATHAVHRRLPYPTLPWPLQISDSQYAPVKWTDIPGWNEDDHLAAYQTFRASCRPISAQQKPADDSRALGSSLREACRAARAADISDSAKARAFSRRIFCRFEFPDLGRMRASSPAITSL
jgi:membrane-bound lytic murein transglycosylase A